MANNPVHFTNYQVHCTEPSAIVEYVSCKGEGNVLYQTQQIHYDRKIKQLERGIAI